MIILQNSTFGVHINILIQPFFTIIMKGILIIASLSKSFNLGKGESFLTPQKIAEILWLQVFFCYFSSICAFHSRFSTIFPAMVRFQSRFSALCPAFCAFKIIYLKFLRLCFLFFRHITPLNLIFGVNVSHFLYFEKKYRLIFISCAALS